MNLKPSNTATLKAVTYLRNISDNMREERLDPFQHSGGDIRPCLPKEGYERAIEVVMPISGVMPVPKVVSFPGMVF